MPPGRVGDRFLVGDVAGRGGMGTVYRATDERTGRPVALKVMRDPDPQSETRFRREAEALAQLNHPGVVRYVAHGRTPEGESYLVMEWIDGEDLASRLARGPLPVRHALALARALAHALTVVHAQAVVHRDIKPHNILLAGRDPTQPVLVDFGIVRAAAASMLTGTGKIIGTPQYMAPEQIQGRRELDARADLFSLGGVLFECLTGRSAFAGEHVMAVLAKILVDRAPTLAELGLRAPPALEALIASLLAKRPEDRPASAGVVAAALDACATAITGER